MFCPVQLHNQTKARTCSSFDAMLHYNFHKIVVEINWLELKASVFTTHKSGIILNLESYDLGANYSTFH